MIRQVTNQTVSTNPEIEYHTPTVRWVEEDFLLESPLPGPNPREEFQHLLEERFAWIKKKLTITIRGKDDFQQWTACSDLAYAYGVLKENWQVIAPTGQGKTYVMMGLLRILADLFPKEWNPLYAFPRTAPLVIEPPKAIPQITQVMSEFGVLAIITSLASLRASLGKNVITWKTVIHNGEPVLYPFWILDTAPICLFLDESQQVKNADSTQSAIIESCAGHGIPFLPWSATPYSRVIQAKIIACALKPTVSLNGFRQVLTAKIWPAFAQECCPRGYGPLDWSPKALRRLQDSLESRTIRWSIPYPHPVITRFIECEFESPESRLRYNEAFEEWQRIRIQRDKGELTNSAAYLVALAKHLQVAEEERARLMVRITLALQKKHETGHKHKISIVLGFAFVTSLELAKQELIKLLGSEKEFDRQVAIIVGGRNCEPDKVAFQADKKRILLMTIACGGAALSLDHNEFNTRQRHFFCSIVWNDIQVAQLAGRGQRLKSKSASYLNFLWFKNTLEREKLAKVQQKIRCLKEIATKASVDNHQSNGRVGAFVDDIRNTEHHDLESLALMRPVDEDQEDTMAEGIVGTPKQITLTDNEDEDNN